MSNLNHLFSQMYKIDEILQNLQYKVPSINQGLELTYIKHYMEKVDAKHKKSYIRSLIPNPKKPRYY